MSESGSVPFPICTHVTVPKTIQVINSNNVCTPNGSYINTLLNSEEGVWVYNSDPGYFITLTRDQDNGNWIIVLSTPTTYVYRTELPPESLTCNRGWIEGVAVLELDDTTSSSSSSSDSSLSSTSSDSSSSSMLKNLYRSYFINCDGPACTSEFYCYYDVIEEWVCSSVSSEVSDSSFLSSQSSSSDSSESSGSSQSDSSQSEPTCSPTVTVIFG
jgi:hypothetical protein